MMPSTNFSLSKKHNWIEMFPNLFFSEPTHTYQVEGVKLRNVTSWCYQFGEKFDAMKWSDYKSKKQGDPLFGVDPAEIRKMWKDKGKEAIRRGSIFHNAVESTLLGFEDKQTVLEKMDDKDLDQFTTWAKWWLAQDGRFEVEAIEFQMYNMDWLLAGTLDLLIRDKKGRYHIIDWKTGDKDLDEPPFQGRMLKTPFHNLPDNKLGLYSLQMSTYKAILASVGVQIDTLNIVHVQPDRLVHHIATDVSETVSKLLDLSK